MKRFCPSLISLKIIHKTKTTILWKSWKSNINRGEVTLLDFLTGGSINKTPPLLNTLKRKSSLCNKLALDRDINATNITNFKVKFFIDKRGADDRNFK